MLQICRGRMSIYVVRLEKIQNIHFHKIIEG